MMMMNFFSQMRTNNITNNNEQSLFKSPLLDMVSPSSSPASNYSTMQHYQHQHQHQPSNQSSSSPSYVCQECLRSFKDVNNFKEHRFQEHRIVEQTNIRRCKLCSYATLLKSKYDCHMRCHLNNKVIHCKYCSYSTINIRHMSRHERCNHSTEINNSKQQQQQQQSLSPSSSSSSSSLSPINSKKSSTKKLKTIQQQEENNKLNQQIYFNQETLNCLRKQQQQQQLQSNNSELEIECFQQKTTNSFIDISNQNQPSIESTNGAALYDNSHHLAMANTNTSLTDSFNPFNGNNSINNNSNSSIYDYLTSSWPNTLNVLPSLLKMLASTTPTSTTDSNQFLLNDYSSTLLRSLCHLNAQYSSLLFPSYFSSSSSSFDSLKKEMFSNGAASNSEDYDQLSSISSSSSSSSSLLDANKLDNNNNNNNNKADSSSSSSLDEQQQQLMLNKDAFLCQFVKAIN